MMKRSIVMGVAIFLVWAGAAMAGSMGNVSGEVTKIDGEMVTVKMADGKTKSIHVDPSGTKKEGKLEVGTHVTADVTSSGHANWIKEVKDDGMKHEMGDMKK